MNCQLCDEEEAFLTLIPTGGEGLPQSVGPRCFSLIGLQTAKDNLPAEEIAAALGPMFVTPAREDLHEEAAKVRKGRKSKAAPEALQAEGTTGGPVEAPPADPDK